MAEWTGGTRSAIRDSFADRRVRWFWIFGLVALFLHGVVDPLVTYLAVNVYGVGIETNSLLAGYLGQGVGAFVVIHLPFYVIGLGVLLAFTWLFSIASPSEMDQVFKFSILAWSFIILWGVLIVWNNLLVLVGGIT